MNPVQYVPRQKKCFDTVTVSIILDSGTPVPFLAGKTVVVLEFRRAIHSYYAPPRGHNAVIGVRRPSV